MTTRLVHRPARRTEPAEPPAPVEIEAPPVQPEVAPIGGLQSVLPMAGAMSSMTLMLVFRGSPLAAVGALAMVVTILATVVVVLSQRGRATRHRRQQRTRYLDYLERLRDELAADEVATRERRRALDPAPAALLDVVADPGRLWERRRADADFLAVRVGTGTLSGRRLDLRDNGTALQPTDPFLRAEARALVDRFAAVPGLPLLVPLDRVGDVSVVGPRAVALATARALLLQVAAMHAPDDVAVAVCRPDADCDAWDWVRWLPHLIDTEQRDDAGPLRRLATTPHQLVDLLTRDLGSRAALAAAARRNLAGAATWALPRLLVLLDRPGREAEPLPLPDRAATAASLGLTVVHLVEDRLQEPEEVAVRITVDADGTVTVEDRRGEAATRATGELDPAPVGLADGLARTLAPLRLSADAGDDGSGTPPADFVELLELGDPRAVDLKRLWRPRSERDRFRVPIGVDDAGRPVLLDLKEPAHLGMGPHGLCIGATGSGKSELLRTLVLALLLTHPPDDLSMVLVDYKGGATFAPFAQVPHVAGVITNLADDMALVERVHTSLAGEVRRRQQLLKDAGNVANVADYQLVREAPDLPPLPPLPQLLVIIDEFAELLTAEPEFIELFLSIGRIGRSIGVQLLLASQRIEGGKLRGLDTYLSYRLGLRTFSELESRTVLDTVDAFHLPPLPGFGYLKVDTSIYQRFKAAYVSGPYRDTDDEPAPVEGPLVVAVPAPGLVVPLPLRRERAEPDPSMPERGTGPTLLSLTVPQLERAGAPVQQIWLPPMPSALPLDAAAGPVGITPDGFRAAAPSGYLRVPVGLLDDPARQWQGRWEIDLTRAGGHLVVIGGPRSGRSTLLRTLVLGLALTHAPTQVAVYGVDLLGGGLQPLAGLPHVGGVSGRGDRERTRRVVEEVQAMLDERERVFRDRRVDSLEELRELHAAGSVPELPSADVVLLVDGYGQLGTEFEELEPTVHALVARGSSYGVHVVATVARWNEVRMAQQSAFGSRVELRLNDPADSTIDRKLASTIRDEQRGRALTDARLVGQVALPRIDGRADPASTPAALAQAVRAVAAGWPGPGAPPVRVLPALLRRAELPGPSPREPGVVLGVEEAAFSPVSVDLLGRDPHLLVLGDAGSGKTNVARLVARNLVDQFDADDLVFAVVDPRRRLADAVPEKYLGGYAADVVSAARLAGAVATELARRSDVGAASAPDLAPGPHVVLLVDDYDIVTAAGSQPLAALAGYLAAGRDIGLHAVVTRRVAGAARGLYEPFVTAVRESGAVGLVMSGDRAEGPLVGSVRAAPQPPGRGLLVRPGERPVTVQTAWADDEPPS